MSYPLPDPQDRTIDDTLNALREVIPPTGLEQRVLRVLSERSAQEPGTSRNVSWFAAPLAVCAALAVLAVLVSSHSTYPGIAVTPALQRASTPAPLTSSAPPSQVFAAAPVPYRPQALRVIHKVHNSRPQVTASQPSAPVQPAPLTPQERLLVQIARSGDPKQLAMLNPDLRARKEAEDDAEFRQYFNESHPQNP